MLLKFGVFRGSPYNHKYSNSFKHYVNKITGPLTPTGAI